MTTHTSNHASIFHQIATFFVSSDAVKLDSKLENSLQPTEGEVITPLLPLVHFLDDVTDGEEPADLALTDLIPSGLSAFDLPRCEQVLYEQIGPSCLINACRLEDRPLTEAEQETAELVELIPVELSKLDVARTKAAIALKENRLMPAPLPDLTTLQRANSTATPALQTAA